MATLGSELSQRHIPPSAIPEQSNDEEEPRDSETPRATMKPKQFAWIRKLGAGIILDIQARVPWYASDWTDAWNYRIVPATALIFFAK